MRTLFFLSLILLFPQASFALTMNEACQSLAKGNPEAELACEKHARNYDVDPELVAACARFSPSLDYRQRCLKSGGDYQAYRICRSAGWSLDGTLTCLRSYPSEAVLKSCQKTSAGEEEQLRCLRIGREATQIDSCNALFKTGKSRLSCLEVDASRFEGERCQKHSKGSAATMKCLKEAVAMRDPLYHPGRFAPSQREVASERSVPAK